MSPVPRNCPPCQEAHKKALERMKVSHTTKDENKPTPPTPPKAIPILPQDTPFRKG